MESTYLVLGVTLAIVVILAFIVQILMGRTRGFVARSTIIFSGAVVVLAVATGVLAVIR